MNKQLSYEDLLKKVHQLESELDEQKTSKSIHSDQTSDIFYKICEYSQNSVALFETQDKGKSFNIKYFNQKAAKKENVKREEIIGKKLINQFPTTTKSGFLKSLQSVYKTGIPQEFPYISFSSDKLTEWKHNFIYKLSEFEIVSIYVDLTNEKIKESTLKEHQDKLQLAMSAADYYTFEISLPSGNIKTDRKLYIDLDYNESEITELLAKTGSLVHKKDFERTESILKEITSRSEQNFSSEIRIKNKNGKWQWFSLEGKITDSFEDKNPKRILGLIKNIQNEKEFKTRLQESETNFKQLSENINDAFWLRSIDHKLIYANPASFKIIGDNFTNIFEDLNAYYNWIHPDDREFIRKKRENNLQKPQKNHYYEHRVINSEGETKWLWIRTFPVFNEKGELYRRAGIASDITEHKKLISDLLKAKEKAEESDQLKSAFLANMSHEIRTPMNGILGFAELLNDPDINDQEKKDYIKIIDSNGKQLLNLINDIIDISKIDVNQISLQNTITDLRPLLNDIQYFFFNEQSRLGKEHIKLELYSPSLSNNIINTDTSRLQQIFNNLINNALKFTEQGSIKIGYTKENIENKEYYKFYVADTGIGISDAMKSVIFERFGQVQTSNFINKHGTGLGLAISKGLVELLGGEIWFESTPEKGSIFYFTVPIRSNSTNGENKSIQKSKKMIEKWKDLEILVVEDDADNLEFIKRLLTKHGAKVFVAKTGVDAVNTIINNDTIKIVLMDIRLPDIDGFEATQRIKAVKPELPIIAQTAYAMYNDREMCLENGCDDYISKPLDKVVLFEKINNYIYN
jgi:PAS domain S-box-containing protein